VWYREMQHNYVPIPFEEEWRGKNIFLDGFFQSEKYFKHRRKEVLESLNFKKYPELSDCISIHVRRGDYLTIPGKHIDNTGKFMERAIGYLHGEKFAVFSDDIEWCKVYFKSKFPDKEFIFPGNDNPLDEIGMISSCRHHVNSSSTFSWWGAWANEYEDKVIVTPREWFQSTQKEDTSDIIPENWIKI